MREKILFDDNWKFHKGDLPMRNTVMKGPDYMGAKTERMLIGPASYDYNDASDSYVPAEMSAHYWRDINLPHDYVIEGTPDLKNPQALGFLDYENAWYRKHFSLSDADRDKRITLYFEGVATNATVYLNGCLMKHNFCGYTPFEVDITDIVFFDKENVLAVYTDASSHEGWWYQGGGIYRHVWLIKTEPIAVDLWGVYVNPQKQDDFWNVNIETTVINSSFEGTNIKVSSEIVNTTGHTIGKTECSLSAEAKEKTILNQTLSVSNPNLWDVDSPNMYTLVTRLYKDDNEIDMVETPFGFRTIKFDSEHGFFLNGRQLKIKGICAHQDFGLTGKAVPDNIHDLKVKMIKDMSANAYRTAHYPHAEAMMDAADKYGIMVMDETRWYESTDEGIAQLETLIKRDRNHPSVILWSVGNEELKHITEQGRRIAKNMIHAVKKLDSSRPVTTAVSVDPLDSTVYDLVDVIGINYNLHLYDQIHSMYPNKPFVSTECCATGTTRGFYNDDSPEHGFCSAYDKDTNQWFLGREKTWKFVTDREWVAGSFQWIAFEHRGECLWPRLCSLSGAIDLYLQKKDAFYQNKSHWSSEPMVHLLPHWNHKGLEGEIIKVWAYTNCDEVELFLNGKSLGTVFPEKYGHCQWDVPYTVGTLKAVAKISGKVSAQDVKETSDQPVTLKLIPENTVEYANSKDVLLLTCVCLDSMGREVPDAKAYITFTTNKYGSVIGTGSDITDHVPPNCPSRKMRAGRCSVAVRTGDTAGDLKVYATSPMLEKTVFTINLK